MDAIQFILDDNEIDRFANDPTGSELHRIATAAAIMWEDYILDDRTYEVDLSYDNLDRPAEFHDYTGFDKKIIIDTHDEFGQLINWFYDPTPFENEEFFLSQTLYRNTFDEEAIFGTPPELMETGWKGYAIDPRGAVREQLDLLTTVLHEMGHCLGFDLDLTDNAFNINPATLGGANVSLLASDEPFYEMEHLEVETALMFHNQDPGQRILPSAIDILALWDESQFSQFDLPRVDFIGSQSTRWDETLNWIGGRVPDGDNAVAVRHGGQVRLNSTFSSARSLKVEGNSSLSTFDDNFLWVEGLMSVGAKDLGEGHVNIGGFSPGLPELEVGALEINFGYVNLHSPSSLLFVNGSMKIGPSGDFRGAGTVYARGLLENDGEILGGSLLGGGELAIRTQYGGRLDLDGASEQGQLTAASGDIRISGLQHEPFSGTASIGPGRRITIEQSFAFDGSIVFTGDPFLNTSIVGAELWLRGRIDVTGPAGIEAQLMVFNNPDQETTVHAGGKLHLLPGRMGIGSAPDVYRGRIMLEQNAYLLLNVGLASSWELAGSMNMTNATVTGDDIINTGHLGGSGTLYIGKLENRGTFDVGNSIGVLNIGEGGRYVQTASGTLGIEIAATHSGSHSDVLNVTLGATLDGALSVSFIHGYLPTAGARYDFLTASSISGQFASLELLAPDGKFVDGRLLYSTNRVTLEILSTGLAADFDQDGDVDSKDLARWKSSVGSTSASHMQGDADGDHDVDGADFLVWQRQLVPESAVAKNTAVPEPATLTVLVSAALAMFVRRHRQSQDAVLRQAMGRRQ